MSPDFDPARERVELVAAGVERDRPGRARVWVRLRAGSGTVDCSANGVPGERREMRLAVAATLDGLTELFPQAPEIELVAVDSVVVTGSDAVLVVLNVPAMDARKLLGTAPAVGGPARTAAMATLDGLNRLLAGLSEESEWDVPGSVPEESDGDARFPGEEPFDEGGSR